MSLEEIASQVKRCKECILSEKRTNAVPGTGSPQAEIMFIGEGPGEKEDKMGLPFVGQAGKYLDEFLSSINLKRENVFITNLVKCRPPQNRDPFPDEVEICTKLYLEKQIELIKPKLIITLGRHALEKFIPDKKISEVHGQPKRLINQKTGKKQVYFPLYHPAAALYHNSLKNTLLSDFKKIPKVLKKITELE